MELKHIGRLINRSIEAVLIVPFMELKLMISRLRFLFALVLIVPFMELKLANEEDVSHVSGS